MTEATLHKLEPDKESAVTNSRPSKMMQSFANHPVIAVAGFIGSVASVFGLLLFFIPSKSEPDLTIDAIVLSLSSIQKEQRQRYFDKNLKGRYVRFVGEFEGAISAAMPAGNQSVQFAMTYTFRAVDGVRVYAVFDEASRDLLPVFDAIDPLETSVAGVLDDFKFDDGMVLYLREANLPGYSIVPR